MLSVVVKADVPGYGGRSIGKLNGKVVLIKGAIPGEVAEVIIEEEKRDFSLGTAVSIISTSPDRCDPPCRYFGSCGGCQLQYIDYSRQVRLKEEILSDCLKRIAKTEKQLSPSLKGAYPWNYRLRGQFKIASGRIGFYKEKSREVVDVETCPLMSEQVNEYLGRARALLHDIAGGITAGEVHISCGEEAVVLLKISDPESVQRSRLDKLWRDFLDVGFSGLAFQSPGRKTIKLGQFYLTLHLENLKYMVSPLSFFQSNWSLNLEVIGILRSALRPLREMKVMDLCSGAGNFSLPLSMDAGQVIAVEENNEAVRDGKRNAEVNGIKNCTFINASIDSTVIDSDVDILVVDPPRPGLTGSTIDNIVRAMPDRIAYVSCNPATLARDLNKLVRHYELESVRMIDFFPQTYHIESLALLGRK
jgi:23S rRNA (uracil1939-C5)-methyltransferase